MTGVALCLKPFLRQYTNFGFITPRCRGLGAPCPAQDRHGLCFQHPFLGRNFVCGTPFQTVVDFLFSTSFDAPLLSRTVFNTPLLSRTLFSTPLYCHGLCFQHPSQDVMDFAFNAPRKTSWTLFSTLFSRRHRSCFQHPS